MRYIIILALSILALSHVSAAASGHGARPLQLARNGTSAYVIALAADAIPAEKTAALELSLYLHQITGARLAVEDETAVSPEAPQILVGTGRRVRKLLPGFNWQALGQDGIVIKTTGRNLILAGGRPRGALYAAYQFLEETLGVRWWDPESTYVPERRELGISEQDIVYTPQFQSREFFCNSTYSDPFFATRLKNNGHNQTQGVELGGHYSILGNVHTFSQLLPIDKYFGQHPEWFSDPANHGLPCTATSKMPEVWQLCLTDEAARRELTKNALVWLRQNPDAGVISISQNDNQVRCSSPGDIALEEREGSPSGPLLHFVNAVAAEIEKEFPHVLVETLAYQYSQRPPRHVRPRGNVVVRLCSIDADFSRPLESDANQTFREDLLGWKAIAPRLYIWDYTANFRNLMLPYPNLRVMGPNLRFFARNNVVGVFEQGDGYTNGTGDMVALRVWVTSHLMWNPALGERQLEREFLNGYYGAAAPFMRAYIDEMLDAFIRTGGRLGTSQSDLSYLDLRVMNRATRLFREAEAAVKGDTVLLRRLRRDRLALDHAWLLRYGSLRAEALRRGEAFEGPANPAAFAAEFVAAARDFGTRQYAEAQWFEAYAPSLLARFAPPAPLPPFLQGRDERDIIDSQEGDFRVFTYNELGALAADPAASNGRAARMAGHSAEWIVQAPVQADAAFLGEDKWRGYLAVRVQRPSGIHDAADTALSCGLYDTSSKRLISNQIVTFGALAKEGYTFIDLGAHSLSPALYVFAAPPGRPDVEAVYIDRLIFVRMPAMP